MNQYFKLLSLNNSILKDIILWDKYTIVLILNKVVFSIIYPLMLSIIPKIIIDSIENELSLNNLIIRIIIISILMAGISWINPSINEKMAAKAEKIRINYQLQLMTSVLSYDYELLNNRQEYEKAKYYVDGNGNIPCFDYIFSLCDWLISIFGLLSCMIILSKNNGIMVIIFIIVVIIEFLFNKRKYSRIRAMNKNMFLPSLKSNYIFRKVMTTNFVRDAVIFETTDCIKNKCIKYSKQIVNELKNYNKFNSKLDLLKILFVFSRDLVICLVVIQNILNGRQNVSDFIFYFGLIRVITKWTNNYYTSKNNLLHVFFSYYDYKVFIGKGNKTQLKEKCLENSFNKIHKIELKNIYYSYGENTVLENINIVIKKNHKIAIIGKNGSGKSTLANIICGLLKPDSGKILVNDKEISFGEYNYLMNKSISVMFQKDELLPEKLFSNISLKEKYNNDILNNSLSKTHMLKKTERLNNGVFTYLVPAVNYDAPDFSEGETQCLLMSRCFYKNTKVNLFDEPTSSLDVKAENFVYKSIIEEKVITIIISHRIANIMNSDTIIVMNKGKIAEIGTHKELINNKGIYYEMYRIQKKLFES